MIDDCYVMTLGEIVILRGLNSNEFNGAVAIVSGVSEQRIVVHLLHNEQKVLVKSENLLEGGGDFVTETEEDNDKEDGNDYDSDGTCEGANMDLLDDMDMNSCSTNHDISDIDLDIIHSELLDGNLENVLMMLESIQDIDTTAKSIFLQRSQELCHITMKSNPNNWLAHEILGDVFVRCNDYDKAVDEYNCQLNLLMKYQSNLQSKAVMRLSSKVLLKIASAKGKLFDAEGELDHLKRASIVDPSNVHVFANIGALYLESGNLEEGLEYFRQAVIIDPLWARGRFHLAYALSSNKEAAFRELQMAVTSCNSNKTGESVEVSVKTFLMIAQMLENNAPSSLSTSDLVLKALLRSINLLHSQTDKSSVDEIGQYYKLNALVYYRLGQCLEKQGAQVINTSEGSSNPSLSGCYDGAISAYRKSCELDADDCSYKLALGNSLRVRAHKKKSKVDLDDSIVVYKSGLLLNLGKHVFYYLNAAIIPTEIIALYAGMILISIIFVLFT
jgi:tetratricopeptide (TPR) repeat protein